MIEAQEIIEAVAPVAVPPELIRLMIARATGTVSRELGYYLGEPQEVVQFYSGNRRLVWLLDQPIDTEPFTLERSWGPTDAYELVPASAYVVEGRRLTVDPGYWAPSFRVTMTVGFVPCGTPAPPPELAAIVRHLVLLSLENAGKVQRGSVTGLQSETIGDYSYTRAAVAEASAALGEDWSTLLKRWRRVRL